MQKYLTRICVCLVFLALVAAIPTAKGSFAYDAGTAGSVRIRSAFDEIRAKIPRSVPAQNSSADGAARFAEMWSGVTASDPDFGPVAGSMEPYPNEVSVAAPEISVRDFAAHIVCRLPENQDPSIHWDCGYEFRGIADQAQYRLIVTSQGLWAFLGDQTVEQAGAEGLADKAGDRLTIDMIAVGAEALFAVNGQFVSSLDIPEIPGSGTVAAASSFHENTAIPDGSISFNEFSIWTIDSSVKASISSEAAGNTFTSVTHGFSLSWDETWFVSPAPMEAGVELALTSDRATALVSTSSGGLSPASNCFQRIIDRYESDPAYSDVAILKDRRGQQVMTPGDDVAAALLRYDYTVNDGQLTTEVFDYVLCARLSDAMTIVQLEQFVPADGFITEKGAMEDLQASLLIGDGQPLVPPGLPAFTLGADLPDDEHTATFNQLAADIAQSSYTDVSPPSLELEMSGPEFAVWNAGVEISDFVLHAEVASMAPTDDWEFAIEFRSVDSVSQYLWISSDATFSTFDVEGTLDRTPSSIDLIVVGEDGYVALDGQLLAVLDLADWLVAGDIVFAAVSADQPAGSTTTLSVERLSILDIKGGISFLHLPPLTSPTL